MAYAIIDSDRLCFAVMDTPDARADVVSVAVPEMDAKYIGATYRDGAWSFPVPPDPGPSADDYAEMTYINSEYTVALLEALM